MEFLPLPMEGEPKTVRKMLEELDGGDDGASKSSAIDDDPQHEEDDEPTIFSCFDDDLFFDIFEFRIELRDFLRFKVVLSKFYQSCTRESKTQ